MLEEITDGEWEWMKYKVRQEQIEYASGIQQGMYIPGTWEDTEHMHVIIDDKGVVLVIKDE